MQNWKTISNNNYNKLQTINAKNIKSGEINTDYLNVTSKSHFKNNLDMSFNKIVNLGSGTNPTDAVNYSQLKGLGDDYILKSGDTMLGIIDMSSNKIINLEPGTNPTDAVNYSQLTGLGNDYILKSGDTMLGIIDMSSNKIINLSAGIHLMDAVNYEQLKMKADISYVDLKNNLKADISYVDLKNNLKADISYVDLQNNLKADISYVNNNFINLNSNQLISGDKIFLNTVNFNNDVKTNLLATDIPNNGTREWLDSSGIQIIEGEKIFLNNINFNGNIIENISQGINNTDAVNKEQMDISLNLRLLKSGDNMSGSLSIIHNAGYSGILTLDTGNGSFNRIANQRFFSSFFNSTLPDYVSKRTADIVAGYNNKKYIGENIDGNWGSEYLSFNVGNNGLPNNNNGLTNEKLRITSGGNIGIGTDNPSETLDISGNTKIVGNLIISPNKTTYNSEKLVNIVTNNNEIWMNPYFSNQNWNSLIFNGDKGIIFTDGEVGSGNLVIGNWGDAGIKIIGKTGYIGVSDGNPCNKLTITENACDLTSTTILSNKMIKIKSGTIIYDVYNLSYSNFIFELPTINNNDECMINRIIYFNIENDAEISLVSSIEEGTTNAINIDNINYMSNSFVNKTSFILIGTKTVGYYLTKPYKTLNNIDQLCLRTKLGTNANNEFAGIRFYGTDKDIGFIRVQTNIEHKDSNMSFLVREDDNIVKSLVINKYINAYKPIIKNEWITGELIHTQIYNENNSGSGILEIKSDLEGKTNVNWKNITYKFRNNNISESIIEIYIDAPYLVQNLQNENDFIQINIYEEVFNIKQNIIKKNIFNNSFISNKSLFPIITTYTPTQYINEFNRNIKFDLFIKSNNATFMICYHLNEINETEIQDKWLIKITEYKK